MTRGRWPTLKRAERPPALTASGSLTEVVRLDGVRGGLTDEDLEKFVQSFPVGNQEEAARSIGISSATLLRWQKMPEFQAAYREARRAAFGQAIARLQQGTSAAATTLLKTMIDPSTPASVPS